KEESICEAKAAYVIAAHALEIQTIARDADMCVRVRDRPVIGQSSATSFPPPLWGKDRERGTTRTASVFYLTSNKRRDQLLLSLASRAVLRRHPSPCPSPTRGEGAVGRAPSQHTRCARG